MSVRQDIYNLIYTKLSLITNLIPTGTIDHVSIWNSQAIPSNIEEQKQYRYPQVYVAFEKANYKEPKQQTYNKNIKGEQNYISNITLYIYSKHLTNETKSFNDKETLIEDIKYAIKGLQGTNFGPLRLISDDYDKDHGNIFESQLIYSTLVQESGVYDNQVEAHNPTGTPNIYNNISLDLTAIYE